MNNDSSRTGVNQGFVGYLSPLMVWALGFGCAVGWGSFVMPGNTFLPIAGPLGTAIGIAIGMAIMLVIGANYHFLMKRLPGPGGAYGYVKQLCNYDHGFLCAWFLVLTYVALIWCNAAAIAIIGRNLLKGAFQFGFHYVVAGYDVYFGETAISAALLLAVCFVCCRSPKQIPFFLQTIFAITVIGGIAAVFGTSLGEGAFANMLSPAFSSEECKFSQVFGIVALTPWAFVGFESISHCVGEFRFDAKKAKWVTIAILITCVLAYILLALTATAVQPEGTSGWQEHIFNLNSYDGVEGLPVFHTAQAVLGRPGLAIMSVAFLGAILTGIIGFSLTSSRLVYSMAQDGIFPKWLGRLSSNGVPANAQMAILVISCFVLLIGRTSIGWVVDVTTIGASIVYGYVSFCAYTEAKRTSRKLIVVTGIAGLLIAVAFIIYFMVPNFWATNVFANESYLILVAWSILGFFVFRRVFRADRNRRFGHSTISWLVMLFLIFFAAIMWVRQMTTELSGNVISDVAEHYDEVEQSVNGDSTFLEDEKDVIEDALTKYNLMQMALVVISLAIMFNIYNTISRREKHASKAKSYFFSTVSHDIRTPLNAIVGFSQMLKMGFKTKDEHDQAVDAIVTSSSTLLRLINDILDISKLDAGRMSIDPVETDCHKLVEEIVLMFRVANKNPNLELRSVAPEMPILMLDSQRIRQIAFNLVSNAIKFTHKGHVEVRASFDIPESAVAGVFRLEVEDTGVGISHDDQHRVTMPYMQLGSKLARHGGTGLGLAICRQLAEAMGGEMTLKSELGVGTTFTITIPDVELAPNQAKRQSPESPAPAKAAVPETAAAKPAPAPTPAPAPAPVPPAAPSEVAKPAASGTKCLIVDDSKMNLLVLKALLAKMGITDVAMAADGREALDKLTAPDAPEFTIVLTDMWMPELDGEGLTRLIRANPDSKISKLPVVVITADVELQQTYKDKGFNALLLKPLTIDMLKSILPSN